MFRGMFSIPQGSAVQPTDLLPIPLTEDSAEEFRALCWVVYALPNEIHLQSTRGADIPRLANAAKMCHKYTLPVFEGWALDMIRNQCQPGSLDYLKTCPSDILHTLMGLALLCNHGRLLSLVETNWIFRARSGELPCNSALAAGEKYNRRQFLADVYYHLNKQLYASNLSSGQAFSDLNLTDQQLLRLLSGHALLSNFWYHLRRDPLPHYPAIGCMSHHICILVWTATPWASTEGSDVLAGLNSARSYVASTLSARCALQ
ncbi:hypothetical protein B0H17DRAFT_1130709 [Mycena rosella]|uniref:Uncharacterized protein n=1 Tax=Mycena rosella TaxID=1033263 RepID=A0AAD7DQC0_MYCRO|nr:hypothetical protein B0H17DRAFT_1130709 [Mycena rosella]